MTVNLIVVSCEDGRWRELSQYRFYLWSLVLTAFNLSLFHPPDTVVISVYTTCSNFLTL